METKKKVIIVVSSVFVCLLLLIIFWHRHTWVDATCTQPKTCSKCGETEGEAFGHQWEEATCTKPKTCSTCKITEGTSWGHKWKMATCTNPQTCSVCKETKGNALGHKWKSATCTTAKTCAACSLTEGTKLGHKWKAATCTTAKTCTTCSLSEGSALGHSYGEWAVTIKATPLKKGEMARKCRTCSKLDSKYYELDSFIVDNKFIFTPEEFKQLLYKNFISLGHSGFGGVRFNNKDGQLLVDIRNSSYRNIGNIGFVADKNTWRMATATTESGFDGILMIISAPEDFVANAVLSVIMTCDPSLSESSARKLGKKVIYEETTLNNITYTLTISGDYYLMTAVAFPVD